MKHTYNTYIVRPEDGALVPVKHWQRDCNPQRAEFVAIVEKGSDTALLFAKDPISVDGRINFEWDKAVELVKAFKPETKYPDSVTKFRLPDRRECLDIYDARFQGLDDALELIGGTPVHTCGARWIWTGDEDQDPEYNSKLAFCFCGSYGNVSNQRKCSPYAVRPVATITI